VNEEPVPESFLDLTLVHHFRDEDPKLQEVRTRLEVDPPQAWYYHIFRNSHTLVILLQVGPAFGDEPETVYEGYHKTENISIFAWSSLPNVGHYHWLHGPIHQLLPSSKVNYLVHTI
jgi:hypothetical protein